jgi:hypothetical protein
MIPANKIETTPVTSGFDYVEADTNISLKTHRCFGGAGISDPSQGRLGHLWICRYATGNITVRRSDRQTIDLSFTVPPVYMVGLAFDNNMAPVIAYQIGTTSYLRYYSAIDGGYITIQKTGTTSCRCTVDDPRPFYNTNSDVVFAFTRGGQLFYTLQRDNYTTEYLVGSTTKKLLRLGPSKGLRLQFGLG